MDYSLSDKDIRKLSGCNKIILYPELNNLNSIDELINDYEPSCIILYQTMVSKHQIYGHWTSLKKIGNKICFMDSYGGMIDQTLKQLDPNLRIRTDQVRYKLSELLKKSRYDDINYNEHRYQKLDPDITTCGRYSGLFIKLKEFDTDMFYNMMKIIKDHTNKSYDEIIVELTDCLF